MKCGTEPQIRTNCCQEARCPDVPTSALRKEDSCSSIWNEVDQSVTLPVAMRTRKLCAAGLLPVKCLCY